MSQSCNWCGAENGVVFDIHVAIILTVGYIAYLIIARIRRP